ncbi:MAG TPA: type I restriction enzyme HsdR N-terminal domain-containing protein [Acetobacteraceae bacterium]|jgi:hypothetical protein|nr:type I restriction enzyme HsdR N-terminal domain-containing protein [Acetobacteraceae bacterium]
MVNIAPRCTNEESTNPILILPFLNFLGYDDRNPDEVCPEHGADFSEKYKNRVDFAILKGASPVIAIECKTLGMALKDERGQQRSYFNAAPTVKTGVITDGLVYEFYADSEMGACLSKKTRPALAGFHSPSLRAYLSGHASPWTASATAILEKVARGPSVRESVH